MKITIGLMLFAFSFAASAEVLRLWEDGERCEQPGQVQVLGGGVPAVAGWVGSGGVETHDVAMLVEADAGEASTGAGARGPLEQGPGGAG